MSFLLDAAVVLVVLVLIRATLEAITGRWWFPRRVPRDWPEAD